MCAHHDDKSRVWREKKRSHRMSSLCSDWRREGLSIEALSLIFFPPPPPPPSSIHGPVFLLPPPCSQTHISHSIASCCWLPVSKRRCWPLLLLSTPWERMFLPSSSRRSAECDSVVGKFILDLPNELLTTCMSDERWSDMSDIVCEGRLEWQEPEDCCVWSAAVHQAPLEAQHLKKIHIRYNDMLLPTTQLTIQSMHFHVDSDTTSRVCFHVVQNECHLPTGAWS